MDGRRRLRKYVTGATRSEALEKLRKVAREAQSGTVTNDQLTVAQFLERSVAGNRPDNVAGSTLDDYADTVRLHLTRPALGRKKLSRLTVEDVDSLSAAKRKDGYRPNSIRIVRAVLRRALGQAEREGLVVRNVAVLSQPPRLDHAEGRSLSVRPTGERSPVTRDCQAGNCGSRGVQLPPAIRPAAAKSGRRSRSSTR